MTQITKDAGASTWAPDRIWLQREQGEGGSHTWCEDSVGDGDLIEEVKYVRADLAPTVEQAEGVQTPYAYEIGERGRTQSLAYPEYLERYATKEERALPRLALYAAPVAPAPAAQEWQPIETAPKTGRTLLLGYPNGAGKWRTVRGKWISDAYIEQNWEEPDDAEAGWYETSVEAEDVPSCWLITPTHWMPLPAAPASSAGEQA